MIFSDTTMDFAIGHRLLQFMEINSTAFVKFAMIVKEGMLTRFRSTGVFKIELPWVSEGHLLQDQ